MNLIVGGVSRRYKEDVWGLRDFSLHLEPGILALVGPNRAGKSTFLGTLAGGVLAALCLLAIAASCRGGEQARTAPRIERPEASDSTSTGITSNSEAGEDTSVCPRARENGTISPALSIYSLTFIVNGVEQEVQAGGVLRARPGDVVRVQEATICAASFTGSVGEACVDLAPVDKRGGVVTSEHIGTHLVPVRPGFVRISGPSETWAVAQSWRGISVVLNHWPAQVTEDLDCARGRCERDDRVTIEFP
ncbi:MAG: hypothetical protein PVJ55_09795 [Anaerolineae bacterium]